MASADRALIDGTLPLFLGVLSVEQASRHTHAFKVITFEVSHIPATVRERQAKVTSVGLAKGFIIFEVKQRFLVAACSTASESLKLSLTSVALQHAVFGCHIGVRFAETTVVEGTGVPLEFVLRKQRFLSLGLLALALRRPWHTPARVQPACFDWACL